MSNSSLQIKNIKVRILIHIKVTMNCLSAIALRLIMELYIR